MKETQWIYDYNQPTTPESVSQVLDARPEVWQLPEEWDWYVFKLEQLLLRQLPQGVEKETIREYLIQAIKLREAIGETWREIKREAEKETGAKVLPTTDIVKGETGLSRAYVDTIYVMAARGY